MDEATLFDQSETEERTMGQAVQKQDETAGRAVTTTEPVSLMEVISRAARDPQTDVGKLERLMAMAERLETRNAKAAYLAALVKMKPELPVINRRGRIEVRKKGASGERDGDIQQSTAFARWEDIDQEITPILQKHGFVLTFRCGTAPDGKVTVTGVLGHEAGHTEETTMALPHDSTGSKNAVQAVGSSTSYGKRYTASLLLNIRTKGEDDDGKAAGATGQISQELQDEINALIKETKCDERKFLEAVGFAAIHEITNAKFGAAKQRLLDRKAKMEKSHARA
jgi:hypothetical protein